MARFFAVVLFALVACLTQDLSFGRPNTALDLATRFQDADNSGHLSAADVSIDTIQRFIIFNDNYSHQIVIILSST